jgi:protein involved in polysaccharide export with SLBB domain
MRTFIVLAAGEVNRPGIALAQPIDRVSTIIDSLGGVTAIGSRSRIELRRRGVPPRIVDLEKFARTGNTEANPYVQDGDLIYVPTMDQSVTVKGAVFRKQEFQLSEAELLVERERITRNLYELSERVSEGFYELIDGERVADILGKTDITPWADLTNAYIQRNEQKIDINLTRVLADETCEDNMLMQDGDVLVIPALRSFVYVEGQVVTPGSFVFQPNLRAMDYIGFAGGQLDEAHISGAYVQRGNKRIWVRDNPIIEEGDKIFVPRQLFKFWQDYVEILSVVGTLLISYLTITQ